MFSLIPGRHIGGPRRLYKVALNASTNNSETMYLTDLRIGEVVKRFVSYNIPNSWPFSFNDPEFIFLLRNSVNDARSEMKMLAGFEKRAPGHNQFRIASKLVCDDCIR